MDIVSYLMGRKSGGGGGSIPEYEGTYSVTPSESAQTLPTSGTKLVNDVEVAAIPSQYIVPTGTKQITANGTGIDVAAYATADVLVSNASEAKEYVFYDYAYYNPTTATGTYHVDFISNGSIYDAIRIIRNGGYTEWYYLNGENQTKVRSINGWISPEHRKIKIVGGQDAENATLLEQLTRIDDWQEPTYIDGSGNLLYLYLDIPYDDFNLPLYLQSNDCYAIYGDGTTNAGNYQTHKKLNGNSAKNHVYHFKGKYVLILRRESGVPTKLQYNGASDWPIFGPVQAANALRKIKSDNFFFGTSSSDQYVFGYCYMLTDVDKITEFSMGAYMRAPIKRADILYNTNRTSIGTYEFYQCDRLEEVIIPDSITTIGAGAFYQAVKLNEVVIKSTTPPTVSNSNAWTDVPTTCKFYIPYDSVSYLSATNYPSPSTYAYIGYAQFASGHALPGQTSGQTHNLIWYATKEDAIAQINSITEGTGDEIYCRYTSIL